MADNLRDAIGTRIILRFLDNGETWAFPTYLQEDKVRCEPVDVKKFSQKSQNSKYRWPKPLLGRYCASEQGLEFELRGFTNRGASPVRYTFTVRANAQRLHGSSDYDENIDAHWVELETVCLAPGATADR